MQGHPGHGKPEPRRAFTPQQRAKQVARSLAGRHPGGVPTDVVTERAQMEGLNPADIQRVLDDDAARGPVIVRTRTIDPATLTVVDLTEVEAVRTRIKGSAYWVSDTERRRFGGTRYLLVCEPENEADPTAVAVYGVEGRKLGHLSTAKAATLFPLLTREPAAAYLVGGEGATRTSIMLWVNVPKADPLRRFLRDSQN